MVDNPFDPTPSWTPPSSDAPSSDASESASDSSHDPVATTAVDDYKAEVAAEKKDLEERIAFIVAEHGGLESNIGFNHPYWGLQNRLRALNSK